jgi:copper(I)-binding protein
VFIGRPNGPAKKYASGRNIVKRLFILLAVTFALAASALAHDYMQGDIHIMKPWSRPLPAVSPNGAAYMTLVNKGSSADRLLSVSTPMAMKAELHTHTMEGGVMKMRRVEAVELVPGKPSVLEPGGLHVMMMGLKKPLVDGNSFPLTLNFERAGTIEVTVRIFEPGEAGHGMKHSDTKHEEKSHGS